jgi:coenzyme PQQ precursor peptide PqqA
MPTSGGKFTVITPCRKAAFRSSFIGAEAATSIRERPRRVKRKRTMAWTTPILVEICIGLEINGYLPAEF